MTAFRCTYRLQLGPGLGFAEARSLVPYLAELGVSHLYLPPSFQAREGSTHGYDVVDPTSISSELGGEEAFRALVAEAMELYRWRGTAYGMTRMLEVCTGITPTITEDPAQPYTFRIAMRIPSGHDVRREVIEELVRAHKPAHVGYVLEVAP